ncbi:MAG TPA: hypothetical protein VKR32_09060 [Puia sp.]|nr:hypothetical protein [Puia sp.]
MQNFKFTLLLIALIIFAQSESLGQSTITNIEAKLFYNENKTGSESENVSGTFSPNIDNGEFSLWNTIIGGGSAEGYSNQTIVIVEVTSKGESNQKQTMQFSAISRKKIVLREERTFSCIGNTAKYKLLFLLNNTGCDEIKIKANLVKDGKILSSKNKIIRFRCGE